MQLNRICIVFISMNLFGVHLIHASIDSKNNYFEARSSEVKSRHNGGGSNSDIESQHTSLASINSNNINYNNNIPSVLSLHQQKFQKRTQLQKYKKKLNDPGYSCQGNFHNQAKLDELAKKACVKPTGLVKGMLFDKFPSLKKYNGPSYFFSGRQNLKMRRIMPKFLSFGQVTKSLNLAKKDYLVFSADCVQLGVVRLHLKGYYTKCVPVEGPRAFL